MSSLEQVTSSIDSYKKLHGQHMLGGFQKLEQVGGDDLDDEVNDCQSVFSMQSGNNFSSPTLL